MSKITKIICGTIGGITCSLVGFISGAIMMNKIQKKLGKRYVKDGNNEWIL